MGNEYYDDKNCHIEEGYELIFWFRKILRILMFTTSAVV